jgi:hypothetical protein
MKLDVRNNRLSFGGRGIGGTTRQDRIVAEARTQAGVALVITLILLSVITFMVVTFLVIGFNQRGATTTHTDQAIAAGAADTAKEAALAQAMAMILGFTNANNYDILVSTNYISSAGYISGNRSLTNVSYNYPNGNPLTGNDALENLSHLLYFPRVPVYITNRLTGGMEFRYYVDLNRNGRYDTNGYLPVISPFPNAPFYTTNGVPQPTPLFGNTLSNLFIGDPEWVSIFDRPGYMPALDVNANSFPVGYPHSPTNRAVARYAFVVIPAGKALDINYMHNYARKQQNNMGGIDGLIRNEGVGSWEMNLASFFYDLNTNIWPMKAPNFFGYAPYFYDPTVGAAGNRGVGFDDSLSVLRYRYNQDYRNLDTVINRYGSRGDSAFTADKIDAYLNPQFLLTSISRPTLDGDNTSKPWDGSENFKHFVDMQELFDTGKVTGFGANTLSNRLWMAGSNQSSYDRYTFYRLLSQLGTDSAIDTGRMNLNYDNLVQANNITGVKSVTNFFGWRPVDFFTNAANRLFASAGLNFDTTRIQIYPTNYYTPSVHRLLQIAANIYDATTNRIVAGATTYPYLPSVFRPQFLKTDTNGTQVWITGYQEVGDSIQFFNSISGTAWKDLTDPKDLPAIQPTSMIYGIPLVIGAKKGFPNFNEFAMQTEMKITRKLEFHRSSLSGPVDQTNQMYTVAISNSFGLEAFNSYLTNISRSVQIFASVDMTAILTNELGGTVSILLTTNVPMNSGIVKTLNSTDWPGFPDVNHATRSFQTLFRPETNHFLFLTNSTYSDSLKKFIPLTGSFDPGRGFYVPRWWLRVRGKIRFYIADPTARRLIDYVNLDSNEEPVDISAALMSDGQCGGLQNPVPEGAYWCTNRFGNAAPNNNAVPSVGIMNQIRVCQGTAQPANWNGSQDILPPGLDLKAAIDFFRAQYDMGPIYYSGTSYSKTNIFYSPYNPTRSVYLTISWQANDPLVHYTAGDLEGQRTNRFELTPPKVLDNIGKLNTRYEPWAVASKESSSTPTWVAYNVKDPLIFRSDDWDFPTNKFANVGWLGRVHRGTPWQTVYMKSTGIQTNEWQKWSGNFQMITNYDGKGTTNLDAALSFPISDWKLFDLFTTAPNENATRSQLSVNQTNIAAWSAVLGNIIVATNTFTNANYTIMDPAGAYDVFKPNNYPPLARMVNGIINARTNFVGTNFHHVGEILAAPELTVKSPFLDNRIDPSTKAPKYLNDQIYEWIPQQIMSLLKGGDLDQPKFVLYCFGQSLKPAEHSLITSGAYQGLCTNYQITAEVVTKTVVRIEGAPNNPHAIIESYNVLPAE